MFLVVFVYVSVFVIERAIKDYKALWLNVCDLFADTVLKPSPSWLL